MNYKKWKIAKNSGVNLANCYHMGEDTNGSFCGAMAVWNLPMPGDIPDMPLCVRHKEEYTIFSEQNILDIVSLFLEDNDWNDEEE